MRPPGAVFSVGTAMLSSVHTGEHRTRAFAPLGSVAGLSLACGPILRGLLTETGGRRLVHGFQLCCLAVACAGMPLIRRATAHERRRTVRIDRAGGLLLCGATTPLLGGMVLGGMVLGPQTGWTSHRRRPRLAPDRAEEAPPPCRACLDTPGAMLARYR
ncbi:hypothetical protein AB0B40_10960 [Streptomyces sp. NPDC042638]|uniref:hypothetical protein n=1 Tax=Streptomyces sp. NPDC042638 TaxID=3154333 RepID=UPI0033D02042